MTTEFDSFDASPLGDFTQSTLGDRNQPTRSAPEYGYMVTGTNADGVVSALDPIYAAVNTRGIPYLGAGVYLQDVELVFSMFTATSGIGGSWSPQEYLQYLGQMPNLRRVILWPSSFNIAPFFWGPLVNEVCGILPTGYISPLPAEFPLVADALTDGQTVYASGGIPHFSSFGGSQLCQAVHRKTSPVGTRQVDFVFGFFHWLSPVNRPMMLNFWNV